MILGNQSLILLAAAATVISLAVAAPACCDDAPGSQLEPPLLRRSPESAQPAAAAAADAAHQSARQFNAPNPPPPPPFTSDVDEAYYSPDYRPVPIHPPATSLQPDVPFTGSEPNDVLWTPAVYKGRIVIESDDDSLGPDGKQKPLPARRPQPERGGAAGAGAIILGPENLPIEMQNADALAPPSTDNGQVENFKWPFAMSHNKVKKGGWARQQNVNVMPIAKELAAVNMRLEAGAIREMHWHLTAEWAYVLKGDLRVSTVTPDGDVWLDDVSAGDLWYFPPGQPHSIQAKNTTKEGSEFILMFDNGSFSEESTFLLTDWLAHVPKEVLAKNFGLPGDLHAFDRIPERELYIFPSIPPPDDVEEDKVVPNNSPVPFTFKFSKVAASKKPGGTVKIVDSRSFTASKTIAAAEVSVEPGSMRELHWHPTQPEWTLFLEGKARVTLFASQSNAQTFDFYPGDIAYIPPSFGHYIENTGNSTLKFLEVLKSDVFQDISLSQWLALTPPNLVKAHLGFSDRVIQHLTKEKQTLVPGVVKQDV